MRAPDLALRALLVAVVVVSVGAAVLLATGLRPGWPLAVLLGERR